jgi:DeoR family transcriptional regulator, suf operon transcriptional repressor
MARPALGTPASEGLLGESRSRLLSHLCGRPQTAVELAERVGTSANAVRVHLDGLRKAGLVSFEVARRGVGKPTHLYSLTPSGEFLLSSAYAPTLNALLHALRGRQGGELSAALREAGQLLAERLADDSHEVPGDGIASAASVLARFGTPAAVEEMGNRRVISNQCCPLSAVVRETPEICVLMETVLTSVSGTALRSRCERGAQPRCVFVSGD